MRAPAIAGSALACVAILGLAVPAAGQNPAPPPGTLNVGPAVGQKAPDFDFDGITRFGKLKDRMKLSDFRGQAVVLAFFPKARSKG